MSRLRSETLTTNVFESWEATLLLDRSSFHAMIRWSSFPLVRVGRRPANDLACPSIWASRGRADP